MGNSIESFETKDSLSSNSLWGYLLVYLRSDYPSLLRLQTINNLLSGQAQEIWRYTITGKAYEAVSSRT
ncbi:MAG: hypothetical protein F6K36_03360 [Symploca sp. SIO3C6]|nr:hypothetical protein [Symploca sp. SIO3C6]